MSERDVLAGTPRLVLATEAMHTISAEDVALADPIAVGLLRTQLARLVDLTDERMTERP